MDTKRYSLNCSDPSMPAVHGFRVAVSGNSATARPLKDEYTDPLLRPYLTKLVQTNVFLKGSTPELPARPIFPGELSSKNGYLCSYTALFEKFKSH